MPPDADAARDALAMIESLHRQDWRAMLCLLDHGDNRMMVLVLARIAHDLIDDLADWWQASPDDLMARLREHHAGG